MTIHQLSISEALASVESSALGLSSLEAERRLREHGLNVVREYARESLWLRLLREFVQFFSLILWVAAALAFVARVERTTDLGRRGSR
jgi:magnesium-transporting ATPase (P-type)